MRGLQTQEAIEDILHIKFTVEENTLDIHLVNFKDFMSSISEKDSDNFKTGNEGKILIVVKTFDLCESFSYQYRFVSDTNPSVIEFVSENPLCFNNRVILRRRDKSPHFFLWSVGSRKVMFNAFVGKKIFNCGISELGSIVTTNSSNQQFFSKL